MNKIIINSTRDILKKVRYIWIKVNIFRITSCHSRLPPLEYKSIILDRPTPLNGPQLLIFTGIGAIHFYIVSHIFSLLLVWHKLTLNALLFDFDM